MYFVTLILSLPTENATLRMRSWRTLKAIGSAALRDGVYLLPDLGDCRAALDGVATEVNAGGGTAYVLPVDAPEDQFMAMFDRTEDYAAIVRDVNVAMAELSGETASDSLKSARKLRKVFTGIGAVDYFPGEAKAQTDSALTDLERRIAQVMSPDEPHFVEQPVKRLRIEDYRNRVWATRRRPWVDRLASAWLIRRYIDPDATILWLTAPADCPDDGLGFDFDGATFTHVGGRVTFEVIAESFGLQDEALKRLGAIVHYLDVGGLQPAEAVGIESVLKGMRDAITDDDQLLVVTSSVFDGLLSSFKTGAKNG